MAHYPVIECACHGAMHAGASLLAMVVNDNAGPLTPRAVLGFIASELAPIFVQPRVVRRR
ncbi:AMP-binding enzyme [Pseudomonas fluorescens]|uniref:AMP-binding enzyme n=1 Tax=Pseudomonas fluorescens TaxID=294 RepID=UPI00123FEE8F